ncbi:acyl-CoA dehydrogenase family protein [Pseudomonas sp. YH-1]|uniref:acyl-CoA dehydrogenase family protein n=1 Tax=Pseudomonas sp. YH-1 TaxID=3384787 RepID=UPI003F7F32E9
MRPAPTSTRYAQQHEQFGLPIESFQLMQNQLFRMSGSLAPTEMLCYRQPQMQDEGIMLDERASMMEGVCTVPMRAT